MALKTKLEVAEIRHDIIRLGKSTKDYVKSAKAHKHTEAGYYDVNNVNMSGAIEIEDAWWLYNYIYEHENIHTILEVGTWFGTSAEIMACAMADAGREGKVYTCCLDNLYLGTRLHHHSMINYYNRESTGVFRKHIEAKTEFNFAFLDGRLCPGDAELLLKLMKIPYAIAVHDSDPIHKGGKNIVEIMKRLEHAESISFKRHVTRVMGLLTVLE
jgi:hypothetical protein